VQVSAAQSTQDNTQLNSHLESWEVRCSSSRAEVSARVDVQSTSNWYCATTDIPALIERALMKETVKLT
jgi:hypothetical protein